MDFLYSEAASAPRSRPIALSWRKNESPGSNSNPLSVSFWDSEVAILVSKVRWLGFEQWRREEEEEVRFLGFKENNGGGGGGG